MQRWSRDFTLKVISGGQTGVDRAALDAALALQIPCGGWCPLGRWAEDGPIPEGYPLREGTSEDVHERTELNILASDATLILSCGSPQDGTLFTKERAEHHHKPILEVDLDAPVSPERVRQWIRANNLRVLNVAGPRESHRPGFVYNAAFA